MEVLPSEGSGVVVVAITKGRPVFWQTWWFLLGICGRISPTNGNGCYFASAMNRLTRQLRPGDSKKDSAERTRIAQELHDTLLQDFLSASMHFTWQTISWRTMHRPKRK